MAYRRGTQPPDVENILKNRQRDKDLDDAQAYQKQHQLDPMDEWIHDLKLSIASILMKDEEKENILRKIGGKLPEPPSPPVMKMPTPASPRGKK